MKRNIKGIPSVLLSVSIFIYGGDLNLNNSSVQVSPAKTFTTSEITIRLRDEDNYPVRNAKIIIDQNGTSKIGELKKPLYGTYKFHVTCDKSRENKMIEIFNIRANDIELDSVSITCL